MEHLEDLKRLFGAWRFYMGALALYHNPAYNPHSKREQKAHMEEKERAYFRLEAAWKATSALTVEEALALAILPGQEGDPRWVDGTPVYPLVWA